MDQLIERFQEQLARISPKDRRALIFVTLFLILVFGYVGLIEPLLIRADQSQQVLAELEDKQRRYTRQVLMLPRREAKLAEYRAELDTFKRHFDLEVSEPEASVSTIMVELSYYARLAKVSVAAIRPLEARKVAEYLELPLEIEASADFDALRKFFYYIDTSSSLLMITDLQLSGQAEGPLQARVKISNIVLEQDQNQASVTHLMPQENRLHLVISRWTGYAPLIVAMHNGYLKSESMQVNLQVTDDNVTIERLLVSGDVDGIGISLPELLVYWAEGIPMKIVFPFGSTAGTEGIAVLPESSVKSMTDMRQKKIGVDSHGIMKFVLDQGLKSADLGLQDVQLQELDTSQVARELTSGTLEVGVIREPYLTSLVDRKQARLIYTSDEMQGLVLDMLAMTPKAIEKKTPVVQFLIDGLFKARKFITEQPERAVEIIAKWENQSVDVTRANLAKITLFDAKQIDDFFDKKRLAKQLATFETYLESIKQPLPLVTVDDIIEPTYVRTDLKLSKPIKEKHRED